MGFAASKPLFSAHMMNIMQRWPRVTPWIFNWSNGPFFSMTLKKTDIFDTVGEGKTRIGNWIYISFNWIRLQFSFLLSFLFIYDLLWKLLYVGAHSAHRTYRNILSRIWTRSSGYRTDMVCWQRPFLKMYRSTELMVDALTAASTDIQYYVRDSRI